MNPHPRILMTADLLAKKKAGTLTDTAFNGRWRTLKGAAGNALTENSREWLPTLAAMSLLTDDPKWVARAEVLLGSLPAKGTTPIEGDRGKAVGAEVFQLAIAYDWLHDRLQPALLLQLQSVLEKWGQWIWPETNPTRATAWQIDAPWSNYYWEYMRACWLAGLALEGDSPVGDTLLNLARNRWTMRALPWLTEHAPAGYMAEGSNYGAGSLVSLLECVYADRTARGFAIAPWVQEAFETVIQMTSPGMGIKAAFGDQSSAYKGVHSDTDRMIGLLMATFGGAAGQARWWLDSIARNRSKRAQELMWDYLFYPSDTPPFTNYAPPIFRYDAGAGYVSTRGGPERDAVQVQVVCGPTVSGDHMDAAGTLIVTRGNDPLIDHAKRWSASGLQHGAEYVNLPTVDGRGQNNQADQTARITKAEDTERTTLIQMDLGQAYNYDIGGAQATRFIKPLKSFRRTLLFLRPGILFVHDQIEKNNPASIVAWHLNHHQGLISAGQGGFMVKEAASELHVKALAPDVPLSLNSVNLGSGGTISSWKTSIIPTIGNAADEFLCAFQFGPTGFVPLPVTKTALGAQVGDDEFTIDASGNVALVDHRISPREAALEALWARMGEWQHGLGPDEETEIQAVVEAAQRLLSVVQMREGQK